MTADGPAGRPRPRPMPRQVPAPPAPGRARGRPALSGPVAGWLLLAASIVVVIGSVMPWATAFGGAISEAGTSGDGAITLVLGLILAASGLLVGLGHGRRWIAVIDVLLAAGITATAAADLSNGLSASSGAHGLVSVGSGLWVTVVGGALTLLASCAVVATMRRPMGR